jgi:hypothetical protein
VTDDFMGPPWQADWTKNAEDNRNALPEEARPWSTKPAPNSSPPLTRTSGASTATATSQAE